MHLFVYEYLSGGGLSSHEGPADGLLPLLAEGRAMCGAMAGDLARINGVEVTCLRDARQISWQPEGCRCVDVPSTDEHDRAFDGYAAEADWTLVIAPEIGGVLSERCRRVVSLGGRPLASSPELIELTSDKHATAEHLSRSGVPAPKGIPFIAGEAWPQDFSYPALWKPRDGAGSQGLRYVEHSGVPIPAPDGQPGRLEEFHPRPDRSQQERSGTDKHLRRLSPSERAFFRPAKGDNAASVAFLCGPMDSVALPPCGQRLDSNFRYLGGWLPLSPDHAQRAKHLGYRAIQSLPRPLGYLGIDLVLGPQADGSGDVVIEINPRLTTSYIGLRALCRENLAEAMLAIAAGEPYNLTFRDELIEFAADGSCSLSLRKRFGAVSSKRRPESTS